MSNNFFRKESDDNFKGGITKDITANYQSLNRIDTRGPSGEEREGLIETKKTNDLDDMRKIEGLLR
jgi:hypothetical protein